MLNATFRPIAKWPGRRDDDRQKSTFRAKYSATLDLLEYELNRIEAADVVIQLDITYADIRNDGWPRSSAKPTMPGVILSFYLPCQKRALSMPCDRFTTWEDNLRAIAKSLEALRMVDRYGVTKNAEQYQGFAAIEAPKPEMTKADAVIFIAGWGGVTMARKRFHPDNQATGSHEMFLKVQKAAEVLGL